MGDPVLKLQPAPAAPNATRRWHNHLPAWIPQDPAYATVRSGARLTLQKIADVCDPPLADGSLVAAYGGQALIAAIGCHRRTFWRHLRVLEAHGYVVLLSRGGTLNQRTYGNVYGIPGRRGALDPRRQAHADRKMVRGPDDRWRPAPVTNAPQLGLWSGEVVSNCHTPRVKLPHPPCQIATPPSPYVSPDESKNHGVSKQASRAKTSRRRQLGHVRIEDLRDTGRLLELYTRAVRLGLAFDSEAGRLMFVAAAEHALRKGDNPAALFASTVRQRRWLFVTHEDENAASGRLKGHLYGETLGGGESEW